MRSKKQKEKVQGMTTFGLERALLFERMLSELSNVFINLPVHEIDKKVNEGLQRVVEFLGIDRSTFAEFNEDLTECRVTHSYAAPGLKPFPRVLLPESLPYMFEKLRHGEVFVMESLEGLPEEGSIDKETFRKWGPKSNISIPLTVGGMPLCGIAFGTLRRETTWPEEMIPRLKLAGEILANAIARRRLEEKRQQGLLEIERLKNQIEAENICLREDIRTENNFDQIIGQSEALKYVFFKIEQVAPTDSAVVILGETGTGKGMIARVIHNLSPRKDRPMVTVNCAALPANLIESELFGREKGAFTGSSARQIGRFEVANGGTIILDEIGELPLELQSKLLRAVQDGEFERLGSPRTIKVDVRIIASTSRNLKEETRKGRFREDLYYRLNVFPITVPPLRQRVEDIPLLVDHFVNKFNRKMGKEVNNIPKRTLKDLQAYPWPGNVRELEHVIERGVIMTQGSVLRLAEGLEISDANLPEETPSKSLMDVERDHILGVLEKTDWRIEGKKGAATILALKPSTLRGRMHRLGVSRHQPPL